MQLPKDLCPCKCFHAYTILHDPKHFDLATETQSHIPSVQGWRIWGSLDQVFTKPSLSREARLTPSLGRNLVEHVLHNV